MNIQDSQPPAPVDSPTTPFFPPPASPSPVIVAAKSSGRSFTVLLVIGLLIAVGGVTFALGRVSAPAAPTRGNFAGANGAPGFNAGTGANGFGAGLGGILLTGTVETVSGSSLTLKETNGSLVTVNLSGTTTYHAQAPASASDLSNGTAVKIQVAGGLGGPSDLGNPGASPAVNPGASPPGAGTPGTRTLSAADITIVKP